MRFNHRAVAVVFSLFAFCASLVCAQPSANELADTLDRAYADFIRQVDQVSITSEITDGIAKGTVTTARFEKSDMAGRPTLKAVQDDDSGLAQMTGMYDGTLTDMVRHAGRIERGQHEGKAVYVVTVDDAAYLKSLAELQMSGQVAAEGFYPKRITLWLDARDHVVRKMEFVQEPSAGSTMEVAVLLDQYQTHRGLPVPHRSLMVISGMDQVVSDPQMQQARRQMEQLKEQLATLPPEQRAMIEQQLAPQLEQFEQMMSPGGSTMESRVTNVSFD